MAKLRIGVHWLQERADDNDNNGGKHFGVYLLDCEEDAYEPEQGFGSYDVLRAQWFESEKVRDLHLGVTKVMTLSQYLLFGGKLENFPLKKAFTNCRNHYEGNAILSIKEVGDNLFEVRYVCLPDGIFTYGSENILTTIEIALDKKYL